MDKKEFEVKPIETEYKGILFRSRTEARWAVFFDEVKIKYLYEHEGYNLGKLGYYLPDFFLPEFEERGGIFAEVKGVKFTEHEELKCKELSTIIGKTVMMLDGPPDYKVMYYYHHDYNTDVFPIVKNGIILKNYGLILADQAMDSNRIFIEPGYQNNDGTISEEYFDCLGDLFVNAVSKAKSYRF